MTRIGRRVRTGFIATVAIASLLAACSALPSPAPSPSSSPHVGGTLRVGVATDAAYLREFSYADPAIPNFGPIMSCCLARTLLAYPGRPTAEGGTVLQPDLAESPPTISRDGITWTFRLRHGIHYAPPYETVELTAADVIRAVERHARLNPEMTSVGAPYGYVAGAAEYASASASQISGLSSPDPYTLVIRLTQPFGALGVWIADQTWAPIPEAVATGHDEDLGRSWVSTGPYMLETYPGDPAATTITLIRNPSWDRATDPRRGAWVDRIELSPYGDALEGFRRVESGELDFIEWPVPAELIERYRSDPSLSPRLRSTNSEFLFWIPMNLALPPFDDVAVRRAVNAVVDRAAMRDLLLAARAKDPGRGPQSEGYVVGHVFPDSLTDGLLLTYAPFSTPGDRGDVARARAEMSDSRYDADGDGSCDAPACAGIVLPAGDLAAGESLRADLAKIGIHAQVAEVTEQNSIEFPPNLTPIQVNLFAWGYNLTGSDLATLLRGGPAITDDTGYAINQSLLGASPEQLATWGYKVGSVPSVDDVIDRCDREVGHLRARCWAELDQFVTSELVPWVPLFSFRQDWLSSARVESYSLDQPLLGSWVGLDQVSLRPDAGP